MKRLLGLAVLFAVLGVCVPLSYGSPVTYNCLVYNLSTTVKGADADTDAKITVSMKGYLVLYFADGCDTPMDANLILYGNDANTPKKQKVFAMLNSSDDADWLTASAWSVGDMIFVHISGEGPYEFEMLLQGKKSLKDIGFGAADKRMVASSIKGINMVTDSFMLGPSGTQGVSGAANASATLNVAETRVVNSNGWGPNAAVDNLQSLLYNKDYRPVDF
jgi:hypothetical protein